ncbi:MAG TPA: hypothetical protein VHA78_03345 [Candidatus Peribacteraceae bacterium]|nr:hypothetical protein [Candidatus Peribacteraceae bacterium]
MKRFLQSLAAAAAALIPYSASAHEAYVLTPQQFAEGMAHPGFDAASSLANPHNLQIFLTIAGCVLLLLIINFIFRHSPWGIAVHKWLGNQDRFGPIIVRVAIAGSFFYSALTWAFLGPEISLHTFPMAGLLRILLFVISGTILLGIFTEISAVIALIIFSICAWQQNWYILTYLNYFGEIVALILFGSRKYSIDRLIFGPLRRFPTFREFESPIVRVCYGIALAYAAINIKFLHPELTVTVVNEYHLTQFHWLFPSDPLLVTFGAALSELVIGIFIILGFEVRLTVLISLFYITMSLLYFREVVWPHFLLYGISLNLIFNKEKFTIDNFVDRETIEFFRNSKTGQLVHPKHTGKLVS